MMPDGGIPSAELESREKVPYEVRRTSIRPLTSKLDADVGELKRKDYGPDPVKVEFLRRFDKSVGRSARDSTLDEIEKGAGIGQLKKTII
jgi:hypothetical protein